MQNVNVLYAGDFDDCDIICVPQCVLDEIDNIPYLCSKWLYCNTDKHHFWILGKDNNLIR